MLSCTLIFSINATTNCSTFNLAASYLPLCSANQARSLLADSFFRKEKVVGSILILAIVRYEVRGTKYEDEMQVQDSSISTMTHIFGILRSLVPRSRLPAKVLHAGRLSAASLPTAALRRRVRPNTTYPLRAFRFYR